MPLLRRLFLDHPASVNETYLEHFGVALAFGLRMVGGGLACIVHAFIPCLFKQTGSNQVRRLHDLMVISRVRSPSLKTERAVDGGR